MSIQPMETRACERVESYISEFTDPDDVNRVRKAYHQDGIDRAMQVAISIKYAIQRAKAA